MNDRRYYFGFGEGHIFVESEAIEISLSRAEQIINDIGKSVSGKVPPNVLVVDGFNDSNCTAYIHFQAYESDRKAYVDKSNPQKEYRFSMEMRVTLWDTSLDKKVFPAELSVFLESFLRMAEINFGSIYQIIKRIDEYNAVVDKRYTVGGYEVKGIERLSKQKILFTDDSL